MHPAPHPGRATVWAAAWPITAVFVLSNAATPLYGLWQREIGFGTGTMTVVFACYIAGLLGALLFAGALSDRIGRRPVLLPALGLAAAASALFAVADSVSLLALARLLTGLAVGATVSAGMAAVSDVAGPGRRSQGSLLASTAMVLGAGLGPLLAGVVSETLPGPTVTVFLIELVLLAAAIAVTLRLPLPRPVRVAASRRVVRIPFVPRDTRGYLAAGTAVFAPGITATSFVLSLGPALLGDLLGATGRTAAGAMAFVMFAAATGVQFAVRGRPVGPILLGAAAVTATAMATLVVAVRASSAVALIAAAVLAGAGQGLGQLGGLTLLATHVPGARRAEANASLNGGGYLLAGTLPVAAGYLSGAAGLRTGATVFAVVLGGLALLGTGLVRWGLKAGTTPRPRRPAVMCAAEPAGEGART
ncbi:MFS transporter [Phytomonospora endophytica]|uniref:MFS family permease n=1 Tax=Phytomonospora endophytica TaxID=714109 RepID=A0A841FIG1_9ACTN|nr:MFS transporter [Phytomonospora endophytica]MBB6035654.1 MFS family permease [Phytomonospora endophytica]GIG69668.1 putative multi-drug efflux transporter [Phytomonospora endophytica]